MPKQPIKLSAEERERRRQRMIELRKKIAEREGELKQSEQEEKAEHKASQKVINEKLVQILKKPKKKQVVEESETESESESSESESEDEVVVKQAAKGARKVVKPKASKPIAIPKVTKQAPIKKVSIKYYGQTSQQEMDEDRMFLAGLKGLTMNKSKKATEPKKEEAEVKKEAEAKPVVKELSASDIMMKSLGY